MAHVASLYELRWVICHNADVLWLIGRTENSGIFLFEKQEFH